MPSNEPRVNSLLTEYDIYLFRGGKHTRIYEKLGAHLMTVDGVEGCHFAVYAPSASSVSVVGEFNFWNRESHPLFVRWDSSGIWEGFIPGIGKGTQYKFSICSNIDGGIHEKFDPYAFHNESPPNTASVVWDNDYSWSDDQWMNKRKEANELDRPYSVYEVHLGSWKKKEGNQSLTYSELVHDLVEYVKYMEFTHVELMPVMEHPFEPSWGYQVTGYFTPTSRFGSPQEFRDLVNAFHEAGIGVILDWVPAHFPSDEWGLAKYDGSHLYEHPDARKGYHPDWKSLIFNFERLEVRSFLISSALYWLREYHIDGLRVDAVASMLYLDYSREEGEWEPNQYGGNHYLAAVDFLKEFNQAVYAETDGVHTIAEESTSYTGVTQPVHAGGLGFGMKWMMGWMNDTLGYFSKEPIYRKFHQNDITFSLAYAFTENFMLPLSHDEVVHGKGHLISKMPGDDWQRFANLRLLYAYMYTHPGTKLLFMGSEFGQHDEWNHAKSLDWHLLQYAPHQGIQKLVKQLNHIYAAHPALYEKQFSYEGFEWIDYSDHEQSVISYVRKNDNNDEAIIAICNFTPITRDNYRIGVPSRGTYKVLLNSDDSIYGGSNFNQSQEYKTDKESSHGRMFSINVALPPLGVLILKKED